MYYSSVAFTHCATKPRPVHWACTVARVAERVKSTLTVLGHRTSGGGPLASTPKPPSCPCGEHESSAGRCRCRRSEGCVTQLDDALGLSDLADEQLADARTGKNGRHALVGLLRQSVFGRLAGYEDVNDAERLRHDPAMRWIVGGKASKGIAASSSQMGQTAGIIRRRRE